MSWQADIEELHRRISELGEKGSLAPKDQASYDLDKGASQLAEAMASIMPSVADITKNIAEFGEAARRVMGGPVERATQWGDTHDAPERFVPYEKRLLLTTGLRTKEETLTDLDNELVVNIAAQHFRLATRIACSGFYPSGFLKLDKDSDGDTP